MNGSAKVDAIREAAAAVRRKERCSRCYKPAPALDSDEFTADWEEATDSSGVRVVCRDCLKTPRGFFLEGDPIGTKVRENRLRRAAERQRCRLVKNRRRDPNAWDYGKFSLIHDDNNAAILQNADLDDVEEWLAKPTSAKQ